MEDTTMANQSMDIITKVLEQSAKLVEEQVDLCCHQHMLELEQGSVLSLYELIKARTQGPSGMKKEAVWRWLEIFSYQRARQADSLRPFGVF
uniref:Uncharacterized protein n=1 Tax=Amphiprion ocellaris TaxID=80972 RepID=A0A3Q1CRF2_AMPOC